MELKNIFIVLFVVHLSGLTLAKKVAGLVVFRRIDGKNEYLMLAAKNTKKDWSPPKGRIDDNEDGFTAAVRETKEETDYSTDDLNIFKEHVRTIKREKKNGKDKKMTFWLAELKDSHKKPVLSHEHSGYLWLGNNEIYWVHDNSEFIEMINDFDDIIEQIYYENPPVPIQNFISRIIISNV